MGRSYTWSYIWSYKIHSAKTKRFDWSYIWSYILGVFIGVFLYEYFFFVARFILIINYYRG
nr:MAG TPA: hypothetical protein [Caudoviricetes sp.]